MMRYFYLPFGPYRLVTKTGLNGKTLNLDKVAKNEFWDRVVKEAGQPTMPEARGVYVFAEKVKYNFRPWYVGQSKTGFKKEVFTHRNRDIYSRP